MNLAPFWDLLNNGQPLFLIAQNILGNLRALVVILFVLHIGYKIMMYMVKIDSPMEPFLLVRPIVIIAAFALYQPLTNFLVIRPMNIVSGVVDAGIAASGIGNPNAINFQDRFIDAMTFVFPGAPGIPSIFDIVAISPGLEIIHLIIQMISMVVAMYMLIRQFVLAALYYIIGTLVLPFALIAGNNSVIGNWYFGFISVLLWEPIIHIMQAVLISLNVAAIGFQSALIALALQVVMILTILQVPKFSSIVVSKGSEAGGEAAGLVQREYDNLRQRQAFKQK